MLNLKGVELSLR